MSDGEGQRTITVTLGLGEGAERYEVAEQSYMRVFRELSDFGEELQTLGEMSTNDLAAVVLALGGRVHEFLRIFVPNVMAEWKFLGYPSPEAFERGERDERTEDRAASIPQIRTAIEAGFKVNGLADLGGLLGKLLGPGMAEAVQGLMASTISEFISQRPKTLPGTSGPEASTTDPSSGASGGSGPMAGERSSAPPSPDRAVSASAA